jgi:hypothetical protein
MESLHAQVRQHYQNYHSDHDYVLPRHQALFTHRTLEQRLRHSYDHLNCWLRSIDEARQTLTFQETHLRATASRFFQSLNSTHSSSQDSTYVPSTTSEHLTITSLTRTLSTSSLTTLSSNDSDQDTHHSSTLTSCTTYSTSSHSQYSDCIYTRTSQHEFDDGDSTLQPSQGSASVY